MRKIWLVVLAALAGCGADDAGHSNRNDSTGDACVDACPELATCSILEQDVCIDICGCFKQRWTSTAYDDFTACVATCGVGDQYYTCVSAAATNQPPFADGAYRANCEAKLSVCASVDSDACNPVLLAVISATTLDLLKTCLGLPCQEGPGGAGACVDDALYCQ